MAYLYILKTIKNSYYIGSTDSIERRFSEHCDGKVKSTKDKLPVTLVFSEYHFTKSEAQKKEYRIKRWKNKKLVEKLIIQGPIV